MLDRLTHMVRHWWRRPHWFPELYSAFAFMGFGAWSMVEPISTEALKSFDDIMRVMPAGCWSYTMITMGVAQFAALWADLRWLRGLAAFCATFLLALVSFGAVMAFPSPMDVFPISFVGINMFALVRAAGNAR